MRKCENCLGPGPCLWDTDHLYRCQACHSDPEDRFFKETVHWTPPNKSITEIRPNEDDSLDEVVAWNVDFFHLEQMDNDHWWARLDFKDGRPSIVINLTSQLPIEGTAYED